jgi:hypothetical protein
MNRKKADRTHKDSPQRQPLQIHLPGFITEKEAGLGDVVKRITYSVGIKPCSGCEKRAAAMNQWIRFSR